MKRSFKKGGVSRRAFLASVTGLGISAGVLGTGWVGSALYASSIGTALNETKTNLEKILSGYVAYGGGSNIKYMPDPTTGLPTVPLEEVFYFDLGRAFCRVDNNPQAFAMETHKMGKVVVDPNSFYMVMISDELGASEFTTAAGQIRLKLTGDLSCATAASVASTRIGGRDVLEPAPFEMEAIHNAETGDSVSFTVSFEEDQAPVNYAIFGPEATFTGRIKTGGVHIAPVRDLTLIYL